MLAGSLVSFVAVHLQSAAVANLDATTPGRLGVFVSDGSRTVTNRADERFSLQSVMKLVGAMVAFDSIDKGKLSLDTKWTIRYEDRSIGVQALAERTTPSKPTTATVRELIELMVQQSDSMAVDVMIERLGGMSVVRSFLKKHQITGVRVDRLERDLQCESVGLRWKPAYQDNNAYEKAVKGLSKAARDKAQRRYMADVRDTATPRGFGDLLLKLVRGKLLSRHSTEELLKIMEGTETYPERLANSIPAPWKFGHKTGSSGTWNGMAVATNDVGVARDASGRFVVIVAFLADAKGDMDARNAVLAKVPGASGFFGKRTK